MRLRDLLPWLLGALAAFVWLRSGLAWPAVVVARLDRCPMVACDFVEHYLPQACLLRERPGALLPTWFYPPLLALALGPACGHVGAAVVAWTAFGLGAAAALVVLCRWELAVLGPRASTVAAIALVSLSLPVAHSLKWGQVSLPLVAVCAWALARPGRASGAAIGAMTALKLYPAAYLVGEAVRRRWRVIAFAAATALALGVALPVAWIGAAPTLRYYRRALYFPGADAAVLGGQGLVPSAVRWFSDARHVGIDIDAAPLLVRVPGGAVWLAVALVALVGAAAWRMRAGSLSAPVRAALAMTTVTLGLVPAWHHYFAFLPFAQAVVLGRAPHGSVPRRLALASWLVAAIPLLALADAPGAYFHYSAWGGTTVAALLAWSALMTLPGSAPARDAL